MDTIKTLLAIAFVNIIGQAEASSSKRLALPPLPLSDMTGERPVALPVSNGVEAEGQFVDTSGVVNGAVVPVAVNSEVAVIRAAALSGKLSMLPGVNLSGLEGNAGTRPGKVNYNYVQPPNDELDYYASKGIKVIRLPFLWERLQPSLLATNASTTIDVAYLQLIENVLIHAQADGMGVVIDMHNYGAYNGIKIGASGGVTASQFGAAWKVIASVIKAYPALLGYDLMNEPNKMPSSTIWPAAAQAAVTAIRQTDTQTAVFVEGDSYASASSWQTVNGKLNIADPSSSIIYEAHVYGDRDSSGTHYVWNTEAANGVTVNTIAQRVSVFDGWCKSNNHMCIVGEIGVGIDSTNWNVELKNGLAQMKKDGLLAAFYWAGGPWWGSNYPLSIEPVNGVARPQMSVLSSFAN